MAFPHAREAVRQPQRTRWTQRKKTLRTEHDACLSDNSSGYRLTVAGLSVRFSLCSSWFLFWPSEEIAGPPTFQPIVHPRRPRLESVPALRGLSMGLFSPRSCQKVCVRDGTPRHFVRRLVRRDGGAGIAEL